MKLRPLKISDANACHAVFHRAVHEGARAHYSEAQLQAWAPSFVPPETMPPEDWADRLTAGFAIKATRWGKVVGFFTMGHDGHIDFAYVLPSEMGKGTAGKLYAACEIHARAQGLGVLSTEASHLARRFFEKRGWRVLAQQMVIRGGVGIENFRMEKDL